jgi:ABC-type transporter Mla subunit MlaD
MKEQLMNIDMKSVVKKLGKLEKNLKNKIESGALYNEVKRFADGQAKKLSQRVKSSKDSKKVMAFVAQRRKQVEKIAADLPREVKTVRTYVQAQRKELQKLGKDLVKSAREGKINAASIRSAIRKATTKKAAPARATTTKKAASKKTTTKKAAKRK